MRKAGNPIAVHFFAMALVFLTSAALCNTSDALDTHSTSKKQDAQVYLTAEISATKTSADGVAAWKEEFEKICSQTEIATSLSVEQLRQLISDSDMLLKKLHGIEDPWTKVYIFRLKNCQNFFNFALEWQEKEQQDLKP